MTLNMLYIDCRSCSPSIHKQRFSGTVESQKHPVKEPEVMLRAQSKLAAGEWIPTKEDVCVLSKLCPAREPLRDKRQPSLHLAHRKDILWYVCNM